MTPTIETLISGIPSLGSSSTILTKISSVLMDPRSNLAHVGQIIEKDPDLTARLLRLGNSAYFGFATRVETVSETISLIGVQQVQDLISVTTVVDIFEGIPSDLVSMKSFWKHSLACGLAARALAIVKRVPKPEKFFVAGLLHDLGRMVLFLNAPKFARDIFNIARSHQLVLRDAEVRVLGFDHTEIGAALLKTWNFPPNLCDSVRFHHHPMLSGAFQMEASFVHIADILAHAMDLGHSGETRVPPLQSKAWERLELPTYVLESVMSTVDEQLVEVEKSFYPSREHVMQ